MIARAKREYIEELRREYQRLFEENTARAQEMLKEEGAQDQQQWRYRKARRKGAAPVEEVQKQMHNALAKFRREDDRYFLERLAVLMGEVGMIQPYEEVPVPEVMSKYLAEGGFPPVTEWGWGDQRIYERAVAAARKGKSGEMERMVMLWTLEALHKWVALLSGAKMVPLRRWATRNGTTVGSARNCARRQTIPAFRQGGKWLVFVVK